MAVVLMQHCAQEFITGRPSKPGILRKWKSARLYTRARSQVTTHVICNLSCRSDSACVDHEHCCDTMVGVGGEYRDLPHRSNSHIAQASSGYIPVLVAASSLRRLWGNARWSGKGAQCCHDWDEYRRKLHRVCRGLGEVEAGQKLAYR